MKTRPPTTREDAGGALPQLLLVDDSAAIVAFEAAALSGLYSMATAADGAHALDKIRELRPALVLLDLSMPIMDGDEVVREVRADRALDDVLLVIVSTERQRAEACLRLGANAYLPKPLKAGLLRATVARLLDQAKAAKQAASLAILSMSVGGLELAVPLARVRAVALMPANRPLPTGPHFLRTMVDFHGQPLAVFDLAACLDVSFEKPLVDRKLVVVAIGEVTLALAVDDVHPPLVVPDREIIVKRAFGGAGHAPLDATLEAIVKTDRGPVAVVDPGALISPEALPSLRAALDAAGASAEAARALIATTEARKASMLGLP